MAEYLPHAGRRAVLRPPPDDERAPVAHVDLYRLASLSGEDPDLLADYVGAHTIAFVEWPAAGAQELHALGHVAARVRLEHAGGDEREVVIT